MVVWGQLKSQFNLLVKHGIFRLANLLLVSSICPSTTKHKNKQGQLGFGKKAKLTSSGTWCCGNLRTHDPCLGGAKQLAAAGAAEVPCCPLTSSELAALQTGVRPV